MFSVRQKREIAEKIQHILKEMNHPELPKIGEVYFRIDIRGTESWSYAIIDNNASVLNPGINPHNEMQDTR